MFHSQSVASIYHLFLIYFHLKFVSLFFVRTSLATAVDKQSESLIDGILTAFAAPGAGHI